jgi:putative ABC transport system permease protein
VTPWRKAAADLWGHRTRTLLVILAIATGLTGFFTVLSAHAVLQREMNRSYLVTNPASAILFTDGINEALLAAVRARPDVADADARAVLTARVRTGQGLWKRIMLFAVRDFSAVRISTISPEGGAWPPQAGGLLVERDAFQVLRAAIGDAVTIRTADGKEHMLRVAGRVHDAGQAQARMEDMVYAYITPETLAWVGGNGALDRLYLRVSGDTLDEAHVRHTAADVKAMLERSGHAVRRVDVPPPGQHPHAVIMGVLLLAVAAFGLLVLALSGVIVVNLFLARLAAERRQIGIMKAIGGSRRQIAAIYLAEAAAMGGAAVAVAIPAGLAGGRALSAWLAVLLNFDLASLSVPIWVYLLVVVVGLLVPVTAVAYPVAAATDVSVRAVLANAGVDPSTFGSSPLDRLLCRLGGAGGPLLLGVRNSLRRRARTALTVTTMSAAGAFFIAALSLRVSMMATLDRLFGAGTYGADHRYAYDQHMLMIYGFLVVVAGILAAVGSLGLMTATSLNVLDRRRELGVLRAIGASPLMVAGIVIVEAVFVSSISWVVAVIGARLLTAGIGSLLVAALFPGGLDTMLSVRAAAGWLALATMLSLVSSVAPAIGASRRTVREEVGYE